MLVFESRFIDREHTLARIYLHLSLRSREHCFACQANVNILPDWLGILGLVNRRIRGQAGILEQQCFDIMKEVNLKVESFKTV